ncbi:caspase family protein, partial [Alsobacter sp. R-9]
MFLLRRAVAIVLALLVLAPALRSEAQTPQGPLETRLAFVVGNDGYEGADLPTAANDAALIADTLKEAGFEVTGARNLSLDMLRSSFREFLDKVAAAGPETVAMVYLSGHGLQLDGENYLVPPGVRLQRPADLAFNAVRLSDFSRALAGLPAKARIAVFDVGHPAPFAANWPETLPGLALMEPDAGSLIAFNTAPGAVAPPAQPPYGPYAQALSEMAREPGLPMAEVFNRARVRTAELTRGAQVPWHQSRLETDPVLFEPTPGAPAPVLSLDEAQARRARPLRELAEAEAYAATLDRDTIPAYQEFLVAYPSGRYARNVRELLATRREAVTWRQTVRRGTPDAYWSYLQRYPRGPHAATARARLARLSAPPAPPPGFAMIPYDVLPPPEEELVFFADPGPRYFEIVDEPIEVVYVAPPPRWWRPPPPPVYRDEDFYFLREPAPVIDRPRWVAPPIYVAAPPPPLAPQGGPAVGVVNPYIAIPAALAAGIVAGRVLQPRPRRDAPPVAPPPGPPPTPGQA